MFLIPDDKAQAKAERGTYTRSAVGLLQAALNDVARGLSLKSVPKASGIDRRVLRRHRDGGVLFPGLTTVYWSHLRSSSVA